MVQQMWQTYNLQLAVKPNITTCWFFVSYFFFTGRDVSLRLRFYELFETWNMFSEESQMIAICIKGKYLSLGDSRGGLVIRNSYLKDSVLIGVQPYVYTFSRREGQFNIVINNTIILS